MTKINWVFIVSVIFIIFGAILTDIYGKSLTAGILMIGGCIVAIGSGIFSLADEEIN